MSANTKAILVVKTAALGDVLRTTAILPGLAQQHAGARIVWVTAPGAVDLVRTHPLVSETVAIDTRSRASVELTRERLMPTRWTRVISLDDEEPLCALASALTTDELNGAYLRKDGQRAYTSDVAPWFDMGLLSVHGKAEADRLKIVNQKSQPQIYAEMLGIGMGKPELHLPRAAVEFADSFAERTKLASNGPVIGLNTGAGGRWVSKQLSVERTIDLAGSLARELAGRATLVVFGGESESARNRAILTGMALDPRKPRAIDAGTENPLFEFAALVARCDLLITSDSLALHMAIAQGVQIVCFFSPTSAAEIELYGQGEKVVSTASDYCSYKPDADNSSITVDRLLEASLRQLDARAARRGLDVGSEAALRRLLGNVRGSDPLSESEVTRVVERMSRPPSPQSAVPGFRKGDRVKVKSGAFGGFDGTVEEVFPYKGMAKVVVTIFGRPTPVELEYGEIELT